MNFSDVNVVILCGGLGTRLREVDQKTPKVLMKIDGEPFLKILIDYLKHQGLRKFVLCTGYMAEHIESVLSQIKDVEFSFSRESEPLGTGGAVKNAQRYIDGETFFIINGDSLCKMEYSELFEFHRKLNAQLSIAVSWVENADDYGTVELQEDSQIRSFREKQNNGSAGFVNAGVYCADQSIFETMPQESKFSLETDFFPIRINQSFYGFKIKENFCDIGTPERYRKAQQTLTKEDSSED